MRSIADTKVLDVQGNLVLLVIEEDIWTVLDITKPEAPMLLTIKRYPKSSLALCSDDEAVAETVV